MIKAIFFCKFLTREGPKVLHQVPDGSIVTTASATQPSLFEFASVSEYLIPRQEFCDRLVTVCINHYRILGYPVCITSRKYDRNEFIFNFAIVLEEEADMSSYQSVLRKLAKLFRSLEEQGQFLSKDEADGGAKVYALCEMILEDLNNYCECMIPIGLFLHRHLRIHAKSRKDESNTINIKLFPMYPHPPPVKSWHVPLSTVRLESLMDVNWDLTMQKIVPHINGINSIRRISELADADYNLTRKAVAHLIYYGCLLMLDIFQFSAMYSVTAEISLLIEDKSTQEECVRYITSTTFGYAEDELEHTRIIGLYGSLKQGQTLKNWCIEHKAELSGIDVRRMITFGIIKGFLYRVQKFAIATSNGASTNGLVTRGHSGAKSGKPGIRGELPLTKYLDGTHCFDEICTELQLSEKDVLTKLKGYGDVQIVHR
ncbi:MAG: Nitrogen permease regulator 2 [Pycnora praestabilis]|nr:MAG: Nitrogen permease regulator 2 [Pycnora praestabilis]